MADGTFAVLTIALGLWNMTQDHCPTGSCLGQNEVRAYTSLSAGSTLHQWDSVGSEIYLRRDTKVAFGPFQAIYGLSITDSQDVWAGVGTAVTFETPSQNAYAQLHTMAGYYARGNGVDLGGPLEFRSGVEIGLNARNGIRYGLSYDHRSNAGIYDTNEGLETVQFRVSIPVN